MFSLFEGAQKKFNNLLEFVAVPEQNVEEQPTNTDETLAEEVSINTAAIGGKLLSYAKIASKTAQEKAGKLSTLVSNSAVFDNSVFENLTKQQEQFKESLNDNVENDIPLPWEDFPNPEVVKQRFVELSKNPEIFLQDAPVGIDEVDIEYGPTAKKLLANDENLKKLRYELVPKKLSEEKFWHNYLYRVSLLRKLIKEENSEEATFSEQPQSSSHPSNVENKEESVESDEKVTESKPEKISPSDEDNEDWETELLNDDYDLVKEATDKPENWEEDLNELLESVTTDK